MSIGVKIAHIPVDIRDYKGSVVFNSGGNGGVWGRKCKRTISVGFGLWKINRKITWYASESCLEIV